jgi:hypothetical protein
MQTKEETDDYSRVLNRKQNLYTSYKTRSLLGNGSYLGYLTTLLQIHILYTLELCDYTE